MEINPELAQLVVDQHSAEILNFLRYRNIAMEMDRRNYPRLAKFFEEQASEELDHGKLWEKHLQARGVTFNIHPFPTVETFNELATLTDIIEKFVIFEKETTADIQNIYDKADELVDVPLKALCTRMLEEQMEEEETSTTLLEISKMYGPSGAGQCHFATTFHKMMPKDE
ncbi:hypothetical protein PCE1_004896 [Barthelona sp. PCE]